MHKHKQKLMPTMSSLSISIKHYAYVIASYAYACVASEDWALGIQEHLNLYTNILIPKH